MDTQRSHERTGRMAPLAQAGLAALVAGSLLAFSTIAFRTAFDGSSDPRAVAVSSPRTSAAEPVVLPTPPRDEKQPIEVVARSVADPTALAATDEDASASVLGIRVKRRTPTATTGDSTRVKLSRPGHGPERKVTRRHSELADDAHKPSHGKGHEKARGKGHHKDHDDDAKSHGRAKGKKKH